MKIYGTQRELIRAVRSSHACPPVMCTIKRISVCTAIHILVGDNDHIEPDGPDLLTLLGTQVLRKSHPSVNGRAISKSSAALRCAFWQPSRIRPSLARFLTVSACRRGPLLLLPPRATDKTHSPNSDGRPTAFADVCFQAGCSRVWFEGRRVQIFVRPEIPLRNSFPDAPKSSSARLRCRISAHAPEKNRFRFSYAFSTDHRNQTHAHRLRSEADG